MAISTGSYYRSFFDKVQGMGRKMVSSDFTLEIAGHEGMYLVTKQCPWPVISAAGEIEIPTVLGGTMYQAQQNKFAQQSPISFSETVNGDVENMLNAITAEGGYFDAKIYHGVPSRNTKFKRIVDCFLQIDIPDTNIEDRGQVLLLSGNIFYHYFGEEGVGNSPTI